LKISAAVLYLTIEERELNLTEEKGNASIGSKTLEGGEKEGRWRAFLA